jgi:hypothetical protein
MQLVNCKISCVDADMKEMAKLGRINCLQNSDLHSICADGALNLMTKRTEEKVLLRSHESRNDSNPILSPNFKISYVLAVAQNNLLIREIRSQEGSGVAKRTRIHTLSKEKCNFQAGKSF